MPSTRPSSLPSSEPSDKPSYQPSNMPSFVPSSSPTQEDCAIPEYTCSSSSKRRRHLIKLLSDNHSSYQRSAGRQSSNSRRLRGVKKQATKKQSGGGNDDEDDQNDVDALLSMSSPRFLKGSKDSDEDNPTYTICRYKISDDKYETKCVDADELYALRYSSDKDDYTYTCGCCDEIIAYKNMVPDYCPTEAPSFVPTTSPSNSVSPTTPSSTSPSAEYFNYFGCTYDTATVCDGDNLFDNGNHKIAVCKYDHSKNKYETKCVDHHKEKSLKDSNDSYTCGCCDENLEYEGDTPEYCF